METEVPHSVAHKNSLNGAFFTSKLLGNSRLNLNKFSSYKDFSQSTTNFERFDHFEQFDNNLIIKSKSISTFARMLSGKIDDLKQKRAMDSGGSAKHTHKAPKFAMICKLKKDEVKQMQNGDTRILKSFFKNMSSESVLRPENFEFMSEQNLQTIIENIRQAAGAIHMEGAQKLEFPLGVWSTNGCRFDNAVRKHHKSGTSRYTQCECATIESGFQHKPLNGFAKQQQNYLLYNSKATQYEPLEKYENKKETIVLKIYSDKAIQCELFKPMCSKSSSTSETKLEHKCTQSEQTKLQQQSSDTSIRLLEQNVFLSKQLGDELSKSLQGSQDSLEIETKDFSKKQDEPRDNTSEAGEAQAPNVDGDLELPLTANADVENVCVSNEEDSDNAENINATQSVQSSSPVQFDESVFAFLDEIYSDLSLSTEDDFRAEIEAEIKNIPREVIRKSHVSSKIPKPCFKTTAAASTQLAYNDSDESLIVSVNSNISTDNQSTSEEDNIEGSVKQSKIPILVKRNRPTNKQEHGLKLLSSRIAKPPETGTLKKNSLISNMKSSVSLPDKSTSLTYIERQRQLIEIIVKGVEQELKVYD